MTKPLPNGTSLDPQAAEQPSERIPWAAYAVSADVSEAYGQPSPALMARAMRGWEKLGALHSRIGSSGSDEVGPA
ncbi:hypothetical protein [Streptomyces sp. NPDC001594]|uniref:hypothetical protein n=1 Tax=Streptomyces sp. NPDC001594 TaxID=3364590 RepID=UPI0036CAC76B